MYTQVHTVTLTSTVTHTLAHTQTQPYMLTHSHTKSHVLTPSTLPPLYACNIPHYSHNHTLVLINPVNAKVLQWAELGVLAEQQKTYKRVGHREQGQGCIWDQIFGPLATFWILFYTKGSCLVLTTNPVR